MALLAGAVTRDRRIGGARTQEKRRRMSLYNAREVKSDSWEFKYNRRQTGALSCRPFSWHRAAFNNGTCVP